MNELHAYPDTLSAVHSLVLHPRFTTGFHQYSAVPVVAFMHRISSLCLALTTIPMRGWAVSCALVWCLPGQPAHVGSGLRHACLR